MPAGDLTSLQRPGFDRGHRPQLGDAGDAFDAARVGLVLQIADPRLLDDASHRVIHELMRAGVAVLMIDRDQDVPATAVRTADPTERVSDSAAPRPCHVPSLTPREQEVAMLAMTGMPARGIAGVLGIGTRTVETHLDHVYRKLGVRSRGGLRSFIDGARAS